MLFLYLHDKCTHLSTVYNFSTKLTSFFMKNFSILIVCMFLSLSLSAQQLYLGPGVGIYHGGFGVKTEYMPVKSLGLHAGVGYYLITAGWNVGVSWKILPDSPRVTPALGAMYGTNAGLLIVEREELNKISTGISFAGGVDIRVGKKNNKIETGIIIPVRSKSFTDHYDLVKNRPDVYLKHDLSPVLFYFGFAFALFDQ